MTGIHAKEIQLHNKEDFVHSLGVLLEPISRYQKNELPGFLPGNGAAHYSDRIAAFETWSRLLWGIAPLVAHDSCEHDGDRNQLVDVWLPRMLSGIINGTDPDAPEFWGCPGDFDQRWVETAAVAYSLLLAPQTFWKPLSGVEKKRLTAWMYRINSVTISANNWEFFRVLINLALLCIGAPIDTSILMEHLNRSLDFIDSLYVGDGWYKDGQTYDYYNAFAFHYYGLLFAVHAADVMPERSARYRARARRFATDFILFFADDGSSIPYGRSLVYRFASVSFFSACVYANLECIPWGQMKGIIFRNLRWWFDGRMLDTAGLLSLGYTYPNTAMTEQYNAPGSPYWALKTYLLCAVPESHNFWQVKESSLAQIDKPGYLKKSQMVISPVSDGGRILYNPGQYGEYELRQQAAKYGKFSYSSLSGFCISSDSFDLELTGCDCSLVLSEDGSNWRVRRHVEDSWFDGKSLVSMWRPWEDVEIRTEVIPLGDWHVRIHTIHTKRRLYVAEGGFSYPHSGDKNDIQETMKSRYLQGAVIRSSSRRLQSREGTEKIDIESALYSFHGWSDFCLTGPLPAMNIVWPRVGIPVLRGELKAGKESDFISVSAVLQSRDGWRLNLKQALCAMKKLNESAKMKQHSKKLDFLAGADILPT
ncbi:DUF2264 domain-containing protein [Alkalispirochaeta americana]|nr:DUF2264 domain-containing protein [Alkalispirochaeta americana]